MNVHNQLNLLRTKYSTPETAEALQAGLSLSQEYIQDLESSLKATIVKQTGHRQHRLSLLKACTDKIKTLIESIRSNPTTTEQDLIEARQVLIPYLDELESYLVKLCV